MKALLYLIWLTLFGASALAGTEATTISGRILKADGTPLTSTSVDFALSVTSPDGSCAIYQETISGINMSGSKGDFEIALGSGVPSFPASAFTLSSAFDNTLILNCSGGTTYTPATGDNRKVIVQFRDSGGAWKTFTPSLTLNSIPRAFFASSAEKLANHAVTDFVLKTGLPTCGAGTFLSWDGTSLSCAGVAGTAGGTVTNVTSGNAYITVATGSTVPALTLNVGTTANTVAAGNDSRIVNALQQSQLPSSCSANQTLTFTSPTGSFSCSSITITGSQVSGAIAGNAAGFTGLLAGDVSGNQGTTSVDKIKGVPLSMTGNATGKILQFDGTNWAPASLPASTAGTVTSVSSANSYLSVANGTNTPTLTLNVGTSTYTVAAGNDSRIVNAIQNAGGTVSIQSGVDASKGSPSVSGRIYIATDTQKIYRDNGSSLVVIGSGTAGGGTVTSVSAANSDISVATGTTAAVLTLNSGTSANQILKLDSSAKIPAVDGSQVTSLNPANLSATIPVSKGGTGQSSFNDGEILVGNTTGNTLSKQSLNGDATMTNAGLVTVTGVKGKVVSSAPTAVGQVLRYNGTTWTPNFVSMFDLRSTITGATTFGSGSGGCTAGQTLTWTAATDNLACTTIAINDSQINYSTTRSPNLVFASPSSASGTPSFRALTAADLPAGFTSQWTTNSSDIYYNAGNVGIGTSTPSYRLDVNGVARVGDLSSLTNYAFSLQRSGTTTAMEFLNASNPTTDNGAYLQLSGRDFQIVNLATAGSGNGAITFSTGYSERVRITSVGNVGIGTISPGGYLLNVNGSAIASAWNSSSDIRLKTNIVDIQNPLDKILRLRGVEFDWRTDVQQPTQHDQTHDIGVIAQEVEKVFPEAVTTAEDGYKSVAYSKLVSPLIAAVRAIYGQLTEMKTQQSDQTRQLASVLTDQENFKADMDAKIQILESKNQKLESESSLKDKEITELKERLSRLEKMIESK